MNQSPSSGDSPQNIVYRLRILIHLPVLYSVRDFLYTPVWDEMLAQKEVEFILVGGGKIVKEAVDRRNPRNITCLESLNSLRKQGTISDNSFIPRRLREFIIRNSDYLNDRYVFDATKLRFAACKNLPHYEIMKAKSTKEQNRFQLAFFDYRNGLSLAEPWPRSFLLFRLFKTFRDKILYCLARVEDIAGVKDMNIDLAMFGRYDLPLRLYYWRKVFKTANVPVVSLVGSWDHPTTKGPLPSGIKHFITASAHMLHQMTSIHGISDKQVSHIGKVQMDHFTDPDFPLQREVLMTELGLPVDWRFILFATNTTGLNEHEVSIARRMAKWVEENAFGENVALVIRCHPQDLNWERDFKVLDNKIRIRCLAASAFGVLGDSSENFMRDQCYLASLLKHTDVLIQSRGSIALDAAAFDTPIISLNFDGELERTKADSFSRENEYAHYKPIMDSGGTWIVSSFEELMSAILGYLKNRKLHQKGRAIIRQEHIEPLDGKASQRLVQKLVDLANT
jgi:CDP-glycerol glycerophosphotransferase (TagB/SpsB family)